jgi:hypothetical protein
LRDPCIPNNQGNIHIKEVGKVETNSCANLTLGVVPYTQEKTPTPSFFLRSK